RATIAKSSTLPHDSAPRVTPPTADEGSMQHNISELTALYTSLQRQYSKLLAKFHAQEEETVKLKDRVKVLEDKEDVAATRSGDDALIKGRSINEGEAAAERIMVPFPLTGPPATIISTGSEVGPTASLIVTRRKGKEVMVESDTPKKKKLQEQIDAQVARELEEQQEKENMRLNEQIPRDAEVARIHAEEELQGMNDSLDNDLVKYQDNYYKVYKFQSQQRRPMTKKQKREYYMAVIKSNLGWRFKDFKGMTFEEIEAKFTEVWKQVEDFIPIGLKEETERLKRKGLNLEKEQVKKQKSSEEAPKIETSTEEITEEKIKEMMQLVPVKDVYVQALQVKHPIIDWKVHTEDLLKQLDREDLNQLWALVKEYLSIRPSTKWKLYDLSGVHHVTAKDKEIFMLVEKDYPLRRGLVLVMISYKLQEKLKEARTRQKSYADKHRRELEFQPGDHVFLKVSPARRVRRFGIKGKLSPRFIGPFKILDRVGEVSYRLALSPQLSHVHDVFHVSLLRG
nr:putative reverse transcriptase domain-containing protein [Tanacetum cinerariifolium]